MVWFLFDRGIHDEIVNLEQIDQIYRIGKLEKDRRNKNL